MQTFIDILYRIDFWLGSSQWFALLLLLTGLYFTLALKLPQFRLFSRGVHMLRNSRGIKGEGDATTFQSLSTALSGTVGTGNIGGVAFAIFLGGPAALFWMWVTAFLGMATKMVEVTLSHKYREQLQDGTYSGGPMYVLDRRLKLKWMGILFAIVTLFSTIGTGTMAQMRSIAESVNATIGLDFWITSLIIVAILALVLIGGVRRIVRVASILAPSMAVLYVVSASVILVIYADNILPSLYLVVGNVFTGSAALGGFIGAGIAQAFTQGVSRGLFSNEAGQGSAPIAHAMAKTENSVDEGVVALLEPFIDTLIICTLTGLVILASGVWTEKFDTRFSPIETHFLQGEYRQDRADDTEQLKLWVNSSQSSVVAVTATLKVENGQLQQGGDTPITVIHSRSIAENLHFLDEQEQPWSGELEVRKGSIRGFESAQGPPSIRGKSLVHSAPLSLKAFEKPFGPIGGYIVTLTLLLFAFTTIVTWSYYGDRAVGYLFDSPKAQMAYKVIFLGLCFIAGITETTIVWVISLIAQTLMALPNLFAILMLRKEVRKDVLDYADEVAKQPQK